jgi:hypothetical protein
MATYWEGKTALYEFDYDGGGGGIQHVPVQGEVLYVNGEEATEYATIQAWSVTGGAWATDDATGKMWVYSCTAAFISNLENNDVIEDSSNNKICDTTGGVTAKEGDWQCAGNWGLGEDPAVPLDADTVIFDGRSTYAPTEGMEDSESGHNLQGAHALVHFKSTWTAGCAGSAEPLCLAPTKLLIDGTGDYYIMCGEDDQASDATITETIINNADATVYLYSNCNNGAQTCQFTNVYLAAGTLYGKYNTIGTDCGCDIRQLYIMPTSDQLSKATVHIEKDAREEGTGPMDIWMGNGTLYIDTDVDDFYVFGGTVYYGTDLGASPESGMDIDRLFLYKGTFYWRPDDSTNPQIDEAHIYGGLFDASGTTNNDRAKVLGDGTNDIYVYTGATMNLANGKGNITLGAGSKLLKLGGTITVDNNTDIALTYDT